MIQVKKGNFTGCLAQVLPEKQMSEAFINSIFLAMSGGFQDAYTYFTRDKVFSNAQTGNVVLMSQHFMMGEWKDGLKYLLPLLAFAFGVLAAERIQAQFRFARRLHWRQGILLLEIAILLIVGFLPQTLNMTATILVSFSCAMQVQAFRKVDGYSYASTMCIGNLRCASEALSEYLHSHDRVAFHVFQGAPSRVFEAGSLLFWHHPVFRTGRRGRRQLIGSLRGTCDLGIRRTSDGECAVNVPGKAACMEQVRTDRKGRV